EPDMDQIRVMPRLPMAPALKARSKPAQGKAERRPGKAGPYSPLAPCKGAGHPRLSFTLTLRQDFDMVRTMQGR
ncbi:MAG: hypothetical protein ACLQVX_01820, partial [Limisphaerales bacterium]